MNGFRIVFWVFVACIAIGLIAVYVPGCQPPDMGDCTWDDTNNHYLCPK